MGHWKRRLAVWVLAAALALSLYPAAGRAVLSDVYFTAVNDQLLELSDETMPFWSGGVLYVPSRVFEGTDLGVNFVRNSNLAMLYTTRSDLRFDLEQQLAYDKSGAEYTGHAVERGGLVFFPLDLVCGYFGLSWSSSRTDTVPLIRITSSSAILDDASFIDAAGWNMNAYYAEYEKAATAAPPEPETPERPTFPGTSTPPPDAGQDPDVPPSAVQAAEGQKVCLIIESLSAEDTRSALELLDGVQATFLLTEEALADGDLVRGLVAGGHAVALRPVSESLREIQAELERARELLWQAACVHLELIWSAGRADLTPPPEEWGCAAVAAELDRRESGLAGSSAALSLLRSIGRRQDDLAVFLGGDGGCLGGLRTLLEGLEEGGYRVCAWRIGG